jgi:hypothetical protein
LLVCGLGYEPGQNPVKGFANKPTLEATATEQPYTIFLFVPLPPPSLPTPGVRRVQYSSGYLKKINRVQRI